MLQFRHPELVPRRRGGIIWLLNCCQWIAGAPRGACGPGEGVKEPGGLRYSPPIPVLTVFICVAASKQRCPLWAGGDGDLPSEVLGRRHSLPPPFPKPTKAGKAGLKHSVLLKVLVIESNSRPWGHGLK